MRNAMFGLCLCASAMMSSASSVESEAARRDTAGAYNGARCGVGARAGVAAGLIGVLMLVYTWGRLNAGLIERADIGDSARDLGRGSAVMSTAIEVDGREVGSEAAESSGIANSSEFSVSSSPNSLLFTMMSCPSTGKTSKC